jgi:hypothetical protein
LVSSHPLSHGANFYIALAPQGGTGAVLWKIIQDLPYRDVLTSLRNSLEIFAITGKDPESRYDMKLGDKAHIPSVSLRVLHKGCDLFSWFNSWVLGQTNIRCSGQNPSLRFL